ncbi:MAG: hypothetical protein U0802_14260 [Candidatus Binatia bacterium]
MIYVIAVANTAGSATAEPITMVDDLPMGLVYQQVNAVGWHCSAAPPRVTCVLPAGLGAGQMAPPIRITVIVNARPGAEILNVAVANSGTESASGDNTTRVSGRPPRSGAVGARHAGGAGRPPRRQPPPPRPARPRGGFHRPPPLIAGQIVARRQNGGRGGGG